ncbi:MAG: prepilin-type N-terminal cleavage/methylation domain-containing protein [candidate division Zixibacteria bacterium]|nr:prepilin-type N-terminal cleavage/methylation domain-containing protein [candidate division Zixibacteria bacterium]
MKNIRIAGQEGLTLLEVLVAMIILSMSLLMLLNMVMIALDGNDWSKNTTVATQLIQEKLEQLRASSNPGNGSDVVADFSRTWSVSSPGNHLRKVDIVVSWENIRGHGKADSMTAYFRTDSI